MKQALSLVAAFALVGCAQTPADYVFTNGRVYTSNEAQPWVEAVAVRGTDIVFVGDAADASNLSATRPRGSTSMAS